MLPRLLLDTHVLLRWLGDAKRLSRDQSRALETAVNRGEPIALSAITLIEIAMLVGDRKISIDRSLDSLLDAIITDPTLKVLQLSADVALDAAFLGVLRDPADRTIAATARVHRLQLVTSDQRIIDSGLVRVVE